MRFMKGKGNTTSMNNAASQLVEDILGVYDFATVKAKRKDFIKMKILKLYHSYRKTFVKDSSKDKTRLTNPAKEWRKKAITYLMW